jgi:hypothetical protein
MTKCRSMVEVTPALASNRHSLVDQYHQLGGRCRRELASKSAKPMLSPSDTRGSGSSLFDRKDANPRGILVTCRLQGTDLPSTSASGILASTEIGASRGPG